jgi:hypothetical protein
MGTFRLLRKNYTVYDQVDALKRMKDSDILAEKERNRKGIGEAFGTAAAGGLIGGAGLAAAYGGAKFIKGGLNNLSGQSILRAGKIGAGVGAVAGGIYALNKRRKINKEVDEYNDRLSYAQRQARRREHRDWKANMTQREGYSF